MSGKSSPSATSVVPGGSFGRSVKMVAWSFLGIRKSGESQQDLARVNPLHIIVAAIGAVGVFVASLIAFVNWVVAK